MDCIYFKYICIVYISSLLKLYKLGYTNKQCTNEILGWSIHWILRVDNAGKLVKYYKGTSRGENRMIQTCRTWSIWEGDGGVSHVTFLHVTSSCFLNVTVCLALEIMWDLLFYKAAFVCLLEKLPSSISVIVIFPSFSSLSILIFLPSCLSLTRSGILSSHWSCSCLSLLKCIEVTKPSASFG